MKDQPMVTSPFAALDTREKMEQWIWWQCQHPRDEVRSSEIEPQALPELKAPEQEEQTSVPEQKAPERIVMPNVHHGQYDAVLKRMNMAGKRAGNYIPWTDSL